MTLGLYLPLKLTEQINNFKNSSGNVNIDYRATDRSDINALGTPYTRVNSPANISLNCFPLRASGSHISGHDSLFKEFPIDVLLENMSGEQRHYFYTTSDSTLVEIRYSHTESQRLNNISYMYHYYTFVDTTITEESLQNKTIRPCIFDENKVTAGLINSREILALTYKNVPTGFSSGLLRMTEQVEEVVTDNLNVNISKVNLSYVGIQSLAVMSSTKTVTKSKFIAIINEDDTVNGSPVLTNRLPNYNVYYTDTNTSAITPDAFAFPLKPGEKALFATTVKDTSSDFIGQLSNTTLSYTDRFFPNLGKSFACIKVRLPDTPYVDSNGNPKGMKFSTNDGSDWITFKNYSKSAESVFKEEFAYYLKGYGIKCYPCEDSTYILQNFSDKDSKFVFQYHPDFSIESVTDLPDIRTDDGSEFLFTPQAFPENYSPSRVSLYGVEGPSEDEDPEYVEYAFRVPPKKSNETISTLFKDSLVLSVKPEELLTSANFLYLVGSTSISSKALDFSTETASTVLDKFIGELGATMVNFTFTKNGSDIVVKNKTNTWADFGLKCDGVSLNNPENYLKETLGALTTVLLRGL